MAVRKPLVLDSENRMVELPAGDSVPGGRAVPFYLQDGTSSPIPLNADGEVPFLLQDGTPSNIPVQV